MSYRRDRQVFQGLHAGDFVVCSAWGDYAAWVPPGKVGGMAKLGGNTSMTYYLNKGPERWFLIDAARYHARHPLGYVIDPAVDCEIVEPANVYDYRETAHA